MLGRQSSVNQCSISQFQQLLHHESWAYAYRWLQLKYNTHMLRILSTMVCTNLYIYERNAYINESYIMYERTLYGYHGMHNTLAVLCIAYSMDTMSMHTTSSFTVT